MQKFLHLSLLTGAIIFFALSCSQNRIIFAHQLQYETSSRVVLDEVIILLKLHEYKVMNEGNNRMAVKNVEGFIDVEYIETEWRGTGLYETNSGSEYQVKYQVWILVSSTDISILPLVQYMVGDKIIEVKNAHDILFDTISFIPEEIRNLVSAKKL